MEPLVITVRRAVSPIAVTLLMAAALSTLGCETTESGRPTSTKKGIDARTKSSKTPAQWSMIDERIEGSGDMEDDQMVVVIVEENDARTEDGDDHDGGDGDHAERRERRITRSVYRMDGRGPQPPMGFPPVIPPNPTFNSGFNSGFNHSPQQGPAPVVPTPPPVMLGVRMRELDPVLATHLNLSPRKVSVLEDVAEELNGHAGGLRDHDIIIAVDNSEDASPSHVRKVLRSKKAGDTIDFLVLRGGNTVDVKVTLEAFDVARFHAATPARIGG